MFVFAMILYLNSTVNKQTIQYNFMGNYDDLRKLQGTIVIVEGVMPRESHVV